MSNLEKRPTFSSKNLTLIAVFTAILCIVSPFSIQAFSVPISLSSLAVFIAATTLGGKNALISTLCYVSLGVIGLPVFSGFLGGFGVIMGVTGGYIIGYLPCAFIVGVIITALKGKKGLYFIAFIVGTIILYIFGTAFYIVVYKVNILVALSTCVVPFLVVDGVKIILATIYSISVKPLLKT